MQIETGREGDRDKRTAGSEEEDACICNRGRRLCKRQPAGYLASGLGREEGTGEESGDRMRTAGDGGRQATPRRARAERQGRKVQGAGELRGRETEWGGRVNRVTD